MTYKPYKTDRSYKPHRPMRYALCLLAMLCCLLSQAQKNVIDEVVWIVGDEAILRSDVEKRRLEYGSQIKGNAYCVIPEQLAIQKLFLHQAIIDSVKVTDAEINQYVENDINHKILTAGSKEKVEEYMKLPMVQIREELFDMYKNELTAMRMREKLTEDVKVTPAEVRRFFKDLSPDSIPYVPTEVEVQIITQTPRIAEEEINRVKEELRGYTDRVTKGETSFQTLARLYSEDPVSARQVGELDYTGRGVLDPAFAAVAFNLTDPTKISKVVESEFGFHIIQLVDKRGDKIKVRHILRKPHVSDEAIEQSLARLDTLAADIVADRLPISLQGRVVADHFTFEDGVALASDDKDTRNNHGLMSLLTEDGRTSRFRMQDLPQEVARVVDTMQVGQVSRPFQMINEKGKTVCAIAKLKNRTEGHKATITEDFQVMKDVVMAKRREEILHNWVVSKIKATYVRVNPQYRDCEFEYEGWIR